MSKVIIGIHGLGNKPCKKLLKRWWWSAIKEGQIRIGKFSYFTRFELVYWADILNDRPLDHRVKNEDNPLYLSERYRKVTEPVKAKPHHLRKKILNFLEKQLDKLFLNENGAINFSAIT